MDRRKNSQCILTKHIFHIHKNIIIRETHLKISGVTASSRSFLVTRDAPLHCNLPVDTGKINFKSQVFRPIENCHPWIYFLTIRGNLPGKHLHLHIEILECDCPLGTSGFPLLGTSC